MGMYDEIRCKYKLPNKGSSDQVYQTKDTPAQSLDNYEIREDGTLWHHEYDTVDNSDPNAEGIQRLVGIFDRVNYRWRQVDDFTGEIVFYSNQLNNSGWIEYSAYFVNGNLLSLNIIEDREE